MRSRALACLVLGLLAIETATAEAQRAIAGRPHRDVLAPGGVVRIERSPWSESWWLGWLPEAAAELWRVWGQEFEFEAYVHAGTGPLLVLLPQADGSPWIVEGLARGWAAAGYPVFALVPQAVALLPGASPRDWLHLLEERIRTGRAALRLARAEFGPSCVVLMGLSVGGIAAVPVAALEPAPDALVLLVAGAGLEEIATATTLSPIRDHAGGPALEPELRDRLREIDPLAFASALDPQSVFLASAQFDDVIPPAASARLWESLRRPTARTYPVGHRSFVAVLPLALREAMRFSIERCAATRDRAGGDSLSSPPVPLASR